MKFFIPLIAALALGACTSSPKESTRRPAREDDSVTPRYVFKGEFSKFVEALALDTDWIIRFSDQYSYMAKNNLHDTGLEPGDMSACASVMKTPHRTPDGRCYFYGQKLFSDQPNVGAHGTRIGRNTKPMKYEEAKKAMENLMVPNPRLVSKELLERKDGKFIPVPSLNLLAAAWLQAQNHDWFSHGKNVTPAQASSSHGGPHGAVYARHFDFMQVPPVPGDDQFPQGLRIPRTRPDFTPNSKHGYQFTYRNAVTHWWDASHIYGSDAETLKRIRTNPNTGEKYNDGRIAVDEENRRLYYGPNGVPITGFSDNWWVGLELLHSLFAMEHNTVARMIKANYPRLTGDEIFEKSRLIVAALIAKIHTVEWTPALLDNRVGHIGLYANWFGLNRSDDQDWRNTLRALSKNVNQVMNGLTGPGALELYNVPFTLTEEFTAVYRMHPLLPDVIEFRPYEKPRAESQIPMQNSTFGQAGRLVGENDHASLDMMYSFLTSHPGALTLNNFPKFMQPITVNNNTEGMPTIQLEMGTIDVLRDRERLVPRYNAFRRALGLKTIKKFSDLTTDQEIVAKLEKIYNGDVEMLDLQVGSLAENDRMEGFAFGITPFSIFQLMASRRLMADPFFTEYFTPQYYTKEGLDWVNKTSLIDVISRHYPEMKKHLRNVVNGFHPWND